MKKLKLVSLLLIVMALAVLFAACASHECAGVCSICGKCADNECTDEAHTDKCTGHVKYGLKVMSFNLDQANGATSLKNAQVYGKIMDELPDLLGVQEETPAWKSFLEVKLASEGYARVGEFRSTEPSQPYYSYREASGIYYNVDRFNLKDSGTFWLSPTPEVEGSVATEWSSDVLFPRVCTWALLTDKRSGEDMAFFNAHFGYETVAAREKSATLIMSRIKALGVKAFLTGDLNFASNVEPNTYDVIIADMEDSRTAAKDTMNGNTFHAYGRGPGETYSNGVISTVPIDYIFATKDDFTALSFKILKVEGEKDNWDDFYSDHFSIVARYEFIK